jgi:hypothetical protein
MVGGKIEGLSNLTVPNTNRTMTCFSRENFGKVVLCPGEDFEEFDYPGELFVQYVNDFERKEIQIIKQPTYDQYAKQGYLYLENKDIWIPKLKDLNKGWVLPN